MNPAIETGFTPFDFMQLESVPLPALSVDTGADLHLNGFAQSALAPQGYDGGARTRICTHWPLDSAMRIQASSTALLALSGVWIDFLLPLMSNSTRGMRA